MPLPNALYDNARQAFGDALISWSADPIKLVMVHTGGGIGPVYTVDIANDTFLTAIPVGSRVATSLNLTNKTNVGGVMGADNELFGFVGGADPVGAIVIYQDTGLDATSRLIAYLGAMQGLPYVPHNASVLVEWALVTINAVTLPRIFKL